MKLATGLLGALGIVLAVSVGPAWAVSAPPASPVPSVAPSVAPSAAASVAPSASPTASWLASPAPEATPFTPGGGMDVPIIPYLIQLLVVTGVVGALGYFSLQYVQKKMPGLALGQATGKQIRLVEKLVIDPKRMVFMVNVGDRYWLCAATEDSVTTIAELTKNDLGGQFAQLLEQEKQRGETH
jgi:flagellar biogenesis protein FliO